MATMITHCIIGEIVFPYLPRLDPAGYGSFLLGCMLVDIHILYPAYRSPTHFYQDDPLSKVHLNTSCQNFLSQLENNLIRPWNGLSPSEQAFAAGYLCHLAADEAWKQMDRESAQLNGVRWWKDLSVPPGVTLTVFDELLLPKEYSYAFTTVLSNVLVPDIFKHVPYRALQEMWTAVKPHVLAGGTRVSYFEMLARLGKTNPEIQTALQEYERHGHEAIEVIDKYLNGLQARMDAMVSRSLEQVPRLWDR